ncbi:unnamed protein product [Psylliodes chrysocephalus]|uniref:trypsin n=1 Tax=Psylliodes chrysocephalus TaxID=3402493 RepID=A0A9P0DCB0_9CUCU|nr:unnamed protein product [Psylliodes chrysocephala]
MIVYIFYIKALILLYINVCNTQSANKLNEPRIINGNECRKNPKININFVVAVYRGRFFSCGGSLLTQNWILTAAHCTYNVGLWPIYVVDAVRKDDKEWGAFYRIRNYYMHPNFSMKESHRFLHNDIALLRLDSPMRKSKTIQFVKLPPHVIEGDVSDIYEAGLLLGWGLICVTKFLKFPEHLMCADLTIKSHAECTKFSRFLATRPITEMCTIESTKSFCFGDSGGPLMCGDFQCGIVSFTFQGCTPGNPNFYTRVDKYLDFIKWTMENSASRLLPLFFYIPINIFYNLYLPILL